MAYDYTINVDALSQRLLDDTRHTHIAYGVTHGQVGQDVRPRGPFPQFLIDSSQAQAIKGEQLGNIFCFIPILSSPNTCEKILRGTGLIVNQARKRIEFSIDDETYRGAAAKAHHILSKLMVLSEQIEKDMCELEKSLPELISAEIQRKKEAENRLQNDNEELTSILRGK